MLDLIFVVEVYRYEEVKLDCRDSVKFFSEDYKDLTLD